MRILTTEFSLQNAPYQDKKGVRTEHRDYIAMSDKWRRCRDVAAGSDAVKSQGTRYLSKLTQQTDAQYIAFVLRANFYNATNRTIGGLVGMLFRKPPTNDAPDNLNSLLKDVDVAGTPFDMFAQNCCQEILTTDRVGVLVDHVRKVDTQGAPLTVAAAEKNNLRPTLKSYCTEDIINWKFAQINNIWTLIQVVLKEQFELPGLDDGGQPSEFGNTFEERYRVLDLANGIYRNRVFRINESGKDELVEEVIPVMNDQPLNSIPFIIITSEGVSWTINNPPMLDLVDLNISHYKSSASYEHGCHFTGLPTFYVAGYQAPVPTGNGQPEQILLGGESALILPDKDGKAAFAEFTGQGLNALVANLDRKEQQMAILGARMLATEGKQALTATTTAIHRTGENSVLSAISISVSLGLSNALTIFANWFGVKQECKYDINRDFLPVTVDGPTLTAIVASWQAGAISDEELFDWMQRGDLIEAEVSFKDHKAGSFQDPLAAIKAAKPPVAPGEPPIKKDPENA